MKLPDDYEYRSCVGKERYGSGGEAAEARQRMKNKARRRTAKQRGKLNIYRCDFCHGFHLGRPIRFRS